ncbi:hypothetical protein TURU_037826 [Turdus rufiventris]|nr:hypothetical protein TURU_037826 [Turdus rufiventris]
MWGELGVDPRCKKKAHPTVRCALYDLQSCEMCRLLGGVPYSPVRLMVVKLLYSGRNGQHDNDPDKLRNFESMTNGPVQADVSAMVKELKEEFKKDMRGMREEMRKINAAPVKLICNGRLLKVKEQQVSIATLTVHRWQYRTNRDAMITINKMIHKLESQGLVSKTHSPFNSPIWPVRKSDRKWRLTADYSALNEVTPPLSAAMPDMLEFQYKLESKAAKWYPTTDIANALFSIPRAAECKPQYAQEPTAPGVETQPHHLPWTAPRCTRKG